MPYLTPEHADEYARRGTLAEALERWVALVAAAGADGLDSDPKHHEGYARALGVSVDEFYTVLQLAEKADRVRTVQPNAGGRGQGTPTKEETAAAIERAGLVAP